MKEICSNPDLVARCGLYCGACGAYRRGRCPGCHEKEKASWCKVRSCCLDHDYTTCADCREFSDPNECKKFNNLIAKFFGLVFRSDRAGCIRQIRETGVSSHADEMTKQKRPSIKR